MPFGYGPKPLPPPSKAEIRRRQKQRIKELLTSEPERPEDSVLGTPTFRVVSQRDTEGRGPEPSRILELETKDIAVARRLARAIMKGGWVSVWVETLWN